MTSGLPRPASGVGGAASKAAQKEAPKGETEQRAQARSGLLVGAEGEGRGHPQGPQSLGTLSSVFGATEQRDSDL